MKFEEVLPAYRAGKTISVPSCYVSTTIWYFNQNNTKEGLIFRKETILSSDWQIEADKCAHCNGTGKEPEEVTTRCSLNCNGCFNSGIIVRCVGKSNHEGFCTCALFRAMK